VQLGFQGANLIIQAINDRIQARRMKEYWDKLEPNIAARLRDDPSLGVLIVVYYSRRQKVGAENESPLEHVTVFQSIVPAYGYIKSEALRALATRPPGISAVGEGELLSESHFIPPRQPVDVRKLSTPFPKLGLATFVPGREKLQGVRWRGILGFDDLSETKLNVPAGMTARFLYLDPPSEIRWFDGSIKYDTEIDRAWISPAEVAQPILFSSYLPVIELDTTNWLLKPIYPKRAGMVFPADAATARLFQTTPPTKDKGALRNYPNMHLVRWVRPEDVRLLRNFRIEP
jgi:hypothetical protein